VDSHIDQFRNQSLRLSPPSARAASVAAARTGHRDDTNPLHRRRLGLLRGKLGRTQPEQIFSRLPLKSGHRLIQSACLKVPDSDFCSQRNRTSVVLSKWVSSPLKRVSHSRQSAIAPEMSHTLTFLKFSRHSTSTRPGNKLYQPLKIDWPKRRFFVTCGSGVSPGVAQNTAKSHRTFLGGDYGYFAGVYRLEL
jgi:hypothetical protein